MTTQGINPVFSLSSGLRKMNVGNVIKSGKKLMQSPRKRGSAMPPLDESVSDDLNNFLDNFSLEFEPGNKPHAVNPFDQSQATLATVECSESSDFFNYDSDNEDSERSLGRFNRSSLTLGNSHSSFLMMAEGSSIYQTPYCYVDGFLRTPAAPRGRRATLSLERREEALARIPCPPLMAL